MIILRGELSYYYPRILDPVLSSHTTQVSEVARERLEELPFSKSGRISPELFGISRTLNPSYALYNCPVKATETANLLEKGFLPDLRLSFPNRPRPLSDVAMMQKFPMVYQLNPATGRSVILFANVSKDELESIMHLAGKCHAVVGGNYQIHHDGCFPRIAKGHCWNYVKVKTETGEDHFVVLDSYSKTDHDKGISDREGYFTSYEDDFDGILFIDSNRRATVNGKLQQIIRSHYLPT